MLSHRTYIGGIERGERNVSIHGIHDQFYPLAHCRGNFEEFVRAGGHGAVMGLWSSLHSGQAALKRIWITSLPDRSGSLDPHA